LNVPLKGFALQFVHAWEEYMVVMYIKCWQKQSYFFFLLAIKVINYIPSYLFSCLQPQGLAVAPHSQPVQVQGHEDYE